MTNLSYQIDTNSNLSKGGRQGGVLSKAGTIAGKAIENTGNKLYKSGVKHVDNPIAGSLGVGVGGTLKSSGKMIQANPSAAVVGAAVGAGLYAKKKHDDENKKKYPALYNN